MKLLKPEEAKLKLLQVEAAGSQPDMNQSNTGTVFTRRWEGDRAPNVVDGMWLELRIQREPDQGTPIDEPIPFGLAVTLAMPGEVRIYEQVRQRLAIAQRARI
ncbi:MAG: hypothetical protein H7841_13205 [Magnetospirillum sp. WYHS-4]